MDNAGHNNAEPRQDYNDPDEPPVPGTSEKAKVPLEELKPTSKGVENAKRRLRAFSIQKKSSLSPVAIPLPKPVCTTVGAVGTVFIGKLASSKPVLKPVGIEELVDPKKNPKPPKPGTSSADYLNIQKKTLSEIEAMKRKMELVDLGIPLGLIYPAPDSDKAMPTKAMPPIKSMMLVRKMRVLHPIKNEAKKPLQERSRNAAVAKNPAKVDEIIREAKKARAEGKSFKFSYEKLLPSYQNPFARKDKDKAKEVQPHNNNRPSRDRKKFGDNFRKFSGHKDEKRGRDWHTDSKNRHRTLRERDDKEQRNKQKEYKSKRVAKPREKDGKPKEKESKSKDKDHKSKEKIDTINLSDEDDDDVQVVADALEKDGKETDVNLKDFVVCDSWSENEEKNKDPTPKKDDKKGENKEAKSTPVKILDPIGQLKQSSTKESETQVIVKVEKLHPVTDSIKFEIEDENDEETLDIFAENASLEAFAKIPLPSKKEISDSPMPIRFDYESKDVSNDGMDESFLESVIAEIKQEDMDEDVTQDKGLVEYDISPKEDERESVTPELDDRIREMYSSRSDYSDGFKSVESVKSTESGFKSTESGYKSIESGYKSSESRHKSTKSRSKSTESNKSTESRKFTESGRKSSESGPKSSKSGSIMLREPSRMEEGMAKSTVDSLETWSFVLKICQPLLFRHDKNKCFKETRGNPKLWFAENPKLCDCVKDRSVVYEELEMCKMELINSVYGKAQVPEALYPEARGWYPAGCLPESGPVAPCSEWEAEDSQERPAPSAQTKPPHTRDEMLLDREYQKFMQAVWPDVEGPSDKSETPRSTPVRETKKRPGAETETGKKKKVKMSSEGWSQESEPEEEIEKPKKQKVGKIQRKRKHSPSVSESDDESLSKKKKSQKKEKKDKLKSKTSFVKRQRLSKKYLKKLKEKQEKQLKKKKKHKMDEAADVAEHDKEKNKKDKKSKKKKLLKQKKKRSLKKKKAKSSSSSSSDSESDKKSKKKGKRKKRKTRKQTSSESNQSDELFDANILRNMKTERLTDDEKAMNFSPNKKHREIINVKQLQNDFVSIQIKKEIEDVNSPEAFEESFTEDAKMEIEKQEAAKREAEKREAEKSLEIQNVEVKANEREYQLLKEKEEHEFKEPEYTRPLTPQLKPLPDENLSQCSSQESIISVKPYEKDDSHLRPSSQNSNYNFHDVMQSEGHEMGKSHEDGRSQDVGQIHEIDQSHEMAQSHVSQSELYEKGIEISMEGDYEQGNYEMYEQMAMEYQSDVASQRVPPPDDQTSSRIETVVLTQNRGEIKCDWRAGDPTEPTTPTTPQRPSRWGDPDIAANTTPQRPSRWGLKPSEVNIVLTGGSECEQNETFPIQNVVAPTVYKIQSLANRTDNNSNTGYDEAYMDMYGASDRLQYGDCFSREIAQIKEVEKKPTPLHSSSLDDRINLALRTTVLGDVAKNDTETDAEPDKGILVTKSLAETRNVKRVSFADGFKPGQDSDTEEPPVRKRKRARRTGCAWPCPASHPDHVSLWDALPPPPAPPGSPPPAPPGSPPPAHLLRSLRAHLAPLPALPLPLHVPAHAITKRDPNSLGAFMPPEPPPGLISF